MLSGLVLIVFYIIVACVIAGLLIYLLEIAPIPAEFKRIGRFLIIALVVLIIIYWLLGLLGAIGPPLAR